MRPLSSIFAYAVIGMTVSFGMLFVIPDDNWFLPIVSAGMAFAFSTIIIGGLSADEIPPTRLVMYGVCFISLAAILMVFLTDNHGLVVSSPLIALGGLWLIIGLSLQPRKKEASWWRKDYPN